MDANTERDARLMRRMASGDEQALLELHRRYAPCLTAAVRRLLPDGENDVHETVEDAFVSAWRTAERFHPERVTARAWLVLLTLRLVLEHRSANHLTLEDLKERLEAGDRESGI